MNGQDTRPGTPGQPSGHASGWLSGQSDGPDGQPPGRAGQARGPWVVRGPRVHVVTTVRRAWWQVAAGAAGVLGGWLLMAGAWLLVAAGLVLGAVAALVAVLAGWPPPPAVAAVVREHVQARQARQARGQASREPQWWQE